MDSVSYYFMLMVSKIFCLLPHSAANFLGSVLGNLLWIVLPSKRRNLALGNIIRCLGVDDEEAVRIARQSTVNLGLVLTEVLRFPVIKKNVDSYVTIEGKEHLDNVVKDGKGAVVISSHSDNWELLGGALAMKGFKFVGVAMKQKSDGANRFILEYRTMTGMHITYKNDVREMYDLLKKGWLIGLIADQDVGRNDGIVMEFLGRPTNCVTGPATLARWGNTPIVPAFIHRNEDGTHKINLYPPITFAKTKDKREDIRHVTGEVNRAIEENIRRYPEEWFWLHDRWKSIREELHLE